MVLETRIRTLWPPHDWHDLTVLVAVSGGADSVAFLRALCAVQMPGAGRLVVAHYNHALRAQADGDEAFVADLAASLRLDCQVGRADWPTGASPPISRSEESARQARYDFLLDRAMHIGARYIATAHTADDQAETVLHRIVRGTGIGGLAGMRRARPLAQGITLIRPLLTVRRADLLAYLHELGQPFREDATNFERRFTRNRLRHELIPQLAEQYNGNVTDALVRLSQLAGEAQDLIDTLVAELMTRAVRFQAGGVLIEPVELASRPRYLVRELLVAVWRQQGWSEQAMGFVEWESLADDLIASAIDHPRERHLPGGVVALRESGGLLLRANTIVGSDEE